MLFRMRLVAWSFSESGIRFDYGQANIDRATEQCNFILNYCKYLATVPLSTNINNNNKITYKNQAYEQKKTDTNRTSRMPNVRQSQSLNGKKSNSNRSHNSNSSYNIFWWSFAMDSTQTFIYICAKDRHFSAMSGMMNCATTQRYRAWVYGIQNSPILFFSASNTHTQLTIP